MRSLISAQALRNSLRRFGTVRAVNGIFGAKSLGFFRDVLDAHRIDIFGLVDF